MDNPSSAWNGSNGHLYHILNFVADPIFVKDRQHRWVFLNEAFCRFMGYRKEAMLNKSDYEFFPKKEADVFWEKDEIVFATKRDNINEEKFTDSQGNIHTIRTKKSLYIAEDKAEYIVGIIEDITDLKKLEEELKERIHGLNVFQNVAVDRELKMMQLKDRIQALEEMVMKLKG